jgi:hypothetical protein
LHPKITLQLTENHFFVENHPAARSVIDMTDENTAVNQTTWPLSEPGHFWMDREGKLSWQPYGHHNQHSAATQRIVEPELSDGFNFDDEIRKFEFKRRFEKIQFQVREEFKSEAAELARELRRSEPLDLALSQPGPCDGDLHSKIMPWRGEK